MTAREDVAAIWLARADYHQVRAEGDIESALETETHQKIADYYTQLAADLKAGA